LWLPEDDEPGIMTIREIDQNKTILMISRNVHGFHLIDTMPKGEKYNA
jgi:hypothetical protein